MEGLCPDKRLPQQGWLSGQQFFKHWKFVATGRYLLSPFPCNTENFRSRTAMHVENFAEQNVWKGKAPAHGHRSHRTQFLPLFVQRRCPARPQKVWGHGAVSRSDGLCKIQGTVWRKPGAVRTLQPASFKHKNNTLQLCSQQPKTNFGRLNNYIRFYLWKRKIPPTQRSDDFVGWIGGKIDRMCCGAVKIFMGNKSSPLCTFLQIWWDLR